MYKFQTTQETHYNRLEFIGNEGNNKSIQITTTATSVAASVTQEKVKSMHVTVTAYNRVA